MARPELIVFEDVDFADPAIMERRCFKQRRCPVIATITDSQITPVDLQQMMEAGMNVARFKMSSHTRGDKIRLLGKIDKAAAACCKKYGVVDWPVATCIELKTCIIKTGILEEEVPFIEIKENSELILTCNLSLYNKCNKYQIFIDNYSLTNEVKIGHEISVDSDEIVLVCIEIIDSKSVMCRVAKGGKLKNIKNVSLRGVTHSRPFITKRDLKLIRFAMEYQVDIIIINYVRHADTIRKAKQYIAGKKIKQRPILLSGICTEEGLHAIDDILKESDGIILSREFLPYELEASKKYRLNNIQKWAAAKCQQVGKPLYLSGGVFHDALRTGKFTDAEISDVANAILDGVTGFILRDCEDIETTLEAIKALNEMCCNVEPYTTTKTYFWNLTEQIPVNAAEASAISCAALANQTNASVIVVPTVTGRTAKLLLWMRPVRLVLAVCSSTSVTRMLNLYQCIVPLLYSGKPEKKWHLTVEAQVTYAIEYAVKRGWLVLGDVYVTLQKGSESSSFCDMVQIWNVTISKKVSVECDIDEGDEQ